jgi:antitoxin CptB
MPQQIDDERAGDAVEELGELRPDAGQHRDRRKQSVEDGGSHAGSLYLPDTSAKSTLLTALSAIRRKRLLYRSWHRGTRESDLILGRFADAHIAAFDEPQLDRYEALLECSDADLFDWVTGRASPPAAHDNDVTRLLLRFSNAAPQRGGA